MHKNIRNLIVIILLYVQAIALFLIQLTIYTLAYYRQSYSDILFVPLLPMVIVIFAGNYLRDNILRIFNLEKRSIPPDTLQKNTGIKRPGPHLKNSIRHALNQHRVLPLSLFISASLVVACLQIHACLKAYNILFLFNHLIFDDPDFPVPDSVIKWWLILSCVMITWLAVNEIRLLFKPFLRSGEK
ncbi:hypothetical protein [Akkermansia sp.]|uniref:hypothetical protein n=1 Tax=Akkermansia sp. TaxID=1872421 RepID=UPI0025C573E8|nr:hypothetical protein [Akkermansia sp.]